jgi:hypothetical protein
MRIPRRVEPVTFSDDQSMSDGLPAGITSVLIKELHRHNDGYIQLAIKSGDVLVPFLSIRADALDSVLPALLKEREKNLFVSINASFCETWTSQGNGRGKPHSTATLRYLCACYADIDYYTKGLSFDLALAAIRELHAAGAIPHPSVIVDSGRGMWLLWLLRDPRNAEHAHLGAWCDNPRNHVQLYRSVQRVIIERLRHIGCDAQGNDAARHIRVPGSLHTGSESIVRWWWQCDAEGRRYIYTLRGMAVLMRIAIEPKPRRSSTPIPSSDRKTAPKRRNGAIQQNRNLLSAFVALIEARGGGFSSGCRNHAIFVFALLLKKNRFTRSEALTRVIDVGRRCRPVLPASECEATVKSAFRGKYRTRGFASIADLFEITPEEADVMSRHTRSRFPHATRFGPIPDCARGVSRRTQSQQRRHGEILRFVAEQGHVPPLRDMQKRLAEAGCAVSHVTVRNDYVALRLSAAISVAGQEIRDGDRQATLDLVA